MADSTTTSELLSEEQHGDEVQDIVEDSGDTTEDIHSVKSYLFFLCKVEIPKQTQILL